MLLHGSATKPLKTCGRCHRELTLESFHRQAARSDGRSRICRECKKDSADMSRLRERCRKYKITAEQYIEIERAQGGACAICREPPPTRRPLHIDHDHACCPGQWACGACIRGLLCSACNTSTTQIFRNRPDLVDAAAEYFARPHLNLDGDWWPEWL